MSDRELRVQELETVLLDVEGSILAYWTDIPEAEYERLRLRIRAALATEETT